MTRSIARPLGNSRATCLYPTGIWQPC